MTTPQISTPASTLERRARNAFTSSIVLMIASFLMVINQTRISFQFPRWQTFADIVIIFLFFLSTIYSAILIRRGESDKGVKILVGMFLFDMVARNAVTAGLGTYFAIGAASIPPFIAITALNPKEFNKVQIYSLFASATIILYDIYAPPYRQTIEGLESMTPAIAMGIGFLILIISIGTLRERQRLLLKAKLSIAAVLIILIPALLLRGIGSYTLQKFFDKQQREALQHQATVVASTLDNFIRSNLNDVRVEGQMPVFANYLNATTPEENEVLREQAFESLRALQYRDLVFVDSYAILNKWGINTLDTNPEGIGENEYRREYFRVPINSGLPFVSNPEYDSDSRESYLYFSAPIRSNDGEIVGVLRLRYKAYILQTLINEYNDIAGKGSYASIFNEIRISPEESVFIVLANGAKPSLYLHSVTPLDAQSIDFLRRNHYIPPGTSETLAIAIPGLDEGLRNIKSQPVFSAAASINSPETKISQNIIATARMETSSWIVTVSQDLGTFLAPLERQKKSTTAITWILIFVSAVIVTWGTQKLIAPLGRLQETVEQVAEGNLEVRATIETEDEIGEFAEIFNEMTAQLQELVASLETRVEERTRALERRARQLQTAAEVGSAAASMRDLNALLFQASRLISERFGFYHVGIFLLDADKEYAVLQAANSPGGRRMLARKHKLKVGEVGIVGYTTGHGEARIALDVGKDAVFFNNPDLPETRSEMALPLIVGGEVVGALDIQSKEPAAFSQEDIETLQVLADQIAIAIENARLFTENQQAIQSLQRVYGEITREAWRSMLQQEARRYLGTAKGVSVETLTEILLDETAKTFVDKNKPYLQDHTLILPLSVRGQVVGALRLKKPAESATWNNEEIEVLQVLVEHLGAALESARLYDEASRKAMIESAISEITAKVGESVQMETIMQTTAKELGKLLSDADVVIQIVDEEEHA